MKTYLSVVLAVLMTCMTAHAAVNIDRTRLVFNERDKAVSLKIENESKKLPYLAYAWVTDSQGQKNDDFLSPCHLSSAWSLVQCLRCAS